MQLTRMRTNHEQTRFSSPKVPGQPVKRRYNAARDPSPLFLPFDPFPPTVRERPRARPQRSGLALAATTAPGTAGEEGRAALR